MVKEGIPFISVPLVLALVFAALYLWLGTYVLLLAVFGWLFLAGFMAYFFRDPRRDAPSEADVVLSAADGRVTRVEERAEGKFVSVFLSPLDVHINRAPIAGRVVKIDYMKGHKKPATRDDASIINERNALTIEGERMTVVCTQIAGILARRIVCWSKQGDELQLGEKFGLIKFSSRTDLLLPHEVEVLVKVGDRVRGGVTIVGRLKG